MPARMSRLRFQPLKARHSGISPLRSWPLRAHFGRSTEIGHSSKADISFVGAFDHHRWLADIPDGGWDQSPILPGHDLLDVGCPARLLTHQSTFERDFLNATRAKYAGPIRGMAARGSSRNGQRNPAAIRASDPDRPHVGLTTYDAKDPDTKYPPIRELRPPAGAPNVLVILIDDVGFGASSAFGGPCQTPNFEKLAANGLRYNRFHTTALCSPTRQALLTGRNHHSAGMGGITEIATSAPGYNSILPNTISPIARTLKLNGYSTAQFGKCHEVPVWQTSPMGPFDALAHAAAAGSNTSMASSAARRTSGIPRSTKARQPVEPEKTPEEGYHFTEDLTNKAIKWVRQQKALMPDKPFFTYFAPGATHAPHHVPKEWIDKYKGKFDQGWDKLREETFARQKKLGVIPPDCQLTERSPEIPAWDTISAEMKPVLCRQMEIYAGFLEHTDHHIGRLMDALKDLEILDDTLIYRDHRGQRRFGRGIAPGHVQRDGDAHGISVSSRRPSSWRSTSTSSAASEAYNHYAVGWAHAMDTPYQWTKQVASHFGGTRNGTIVHWPKGIKAKGEIRTSSIM